MTPVMRVSILAVLTASLIDVSAQAADAPGEIKLGTLYASYGPFSDTSVPLQRGLKFWVDQKNEEGGVYAKPFDKKIPVKLVAHDDRGDAAAAASLYRQLITEDKVDILIADSGPALTSVAVPIAREHKMLLIDQNGLESAFFTSAIYPRP
jgi:branched-chain amino acid transport system substrate-binding protein